MTRLIFLNPEVLGACIYPLPTPDSPFDGKACNAFKSLITEVDDVAIILLTTFSPSLERVKSVWAEHGLSGHRMIGIIEDRGGILAPSHSVHNFLFNNKFSRNPLRFDSFVIIDTMPKEVSYPERLVKVDKLLTYHHVEEALQILETAFDSNQVKKGRLLSEHYQGDCVVS